MQALRVDLLEQLLAQMAAREMQTRWHQQDFLPQGLAAALVLVELELEAAQAVLADFLLLEAARVELLHLQRAHLEQAVLERTALQL